MQRPFSSAHRTIRQKVYLRASFWTLFQHIQRRFFEGWTLLDDANWQYFSSLNRVPRLVDHGRKRCWFRHPANLETDIQKKLNRFAIRNDFLVYLVRGHFYYLSDAYRWHIHYGRHLGGNHLVVPCRLREWKCGIRLCGGIQFRIH